MRTTWNGSVAFGLVNIPVGLAPATKPAARQSDVSFRQLHRECGTPIKQKRWCPIHDREVESEEIVKGWEASKGQYLEVEASELEALEAQDTSRVIEISQFVDIDDIDPIYFDRTYFLVPGATLAARRPYVLVQQAMLQTERAALGRFVLAGKEKLVLIRPRNGALALETLFLGEDVYSQAEIDEAVQVTDASDAEIALAKQVIDSLASAFDPGILVSEYRGKLRSMLEDKLAGSALVIPPMQTEEPSQVLDLMEALQRSVTDAKEAQQAEAATKPTAKKGSRKKSLTS